MKTPKACVQKSSHAPQLETYFLNRSDQALALAEATGPECGVCLDTFHLNIEEADPYQAILNTGERLYNFHVSDTNRFAWTRYHHKENTMFQ